MHKGNTSGSKYLRQFNHVQRKPRVWTERETQLLHLANFWLNSGVPMKEVLRRIDTLNRKEAV